MFPITKFERCPHFLSYSVMQEDVRRVNKENIEQDASLKAIHKRMDNVGEDIKELAKASMGQQEVLTKHMEWEEKYHDKFLSMIRKSVMFLAMTVTPAVIGYVVWNYNAHQATMIHAATQSELIKHSNQTNTSLSSTLESINEELKATRRDVVRLDTEIKSNRNMLNRAYNKIEGE